MARAIDTIFLAVSGISPIDVINRNLFLNFRKIDYVGGVGFFEAKKRYGLCALNYHRHCIGPSEEINEGFQPREEIGNTAKKIKLEKWAKKGSL